jgi:hypothetical protein
MELAIPVSDRVQIQDVRLIRCNCRIEPAALAPPLPARFRPTLAREASTQISADGTRIAVLVHFRFSAIREGRENDGPCVDIESTFLVSYGAENLPGLGPENFNSFGALNGVFNAWPYWRELLHNMTSRMGLSAFMLPVLRIGSPAQDRANAEHAPNNATQEGHGQSPRP